MSNERFRLPRLFHSRSESNLQSKVRLSQDNSDAGSENDRLPKIERKLTSSKSVVSPTSFESTVNSVLPNEHGRLRREEEIDFGSRENEEEDNPLPPVLINSSDKPIKYTNGHPPLKVSLLTSRHMSPSSTSKSSTISLQSDRKIETLRQLHSPSSASSSSGSSASLISKQSALTTESVASIALTPITAQHARTRSYIVGSVNHQHSLLGHQELLRYFPNRTATIAVITWNMCGRSAETAQLGTLLLPERMSYVPDIYSIGVQEGPFSSGGGAADQRAWELQLQTTLGPSHVLLHSALYGVLHLAVFVRRDLIWFCSLPENSSVASKSSAANMIKTKGAVAISFKLFGSSLLFVNCHLPAHERRNPQRIQEYRRICAQLSLPRNLNPLPTKYNSQDVTERFDYVFWFGDLNFRVERQQSDMIKLLTQLTLIANPNLNGLLLNDQLIKAIQKGEIFSGFQEADAIRFLPTYKYIIGSNNFDDVSNRVPSWTDRILYRVKQPNANVSCLVYDSCESINSSDHKPVYSLMELQIKAGRDADVPLNAGLFNRDVYVDGVRKRRELWNQMLKHKHSYDRDSHVCSVS